jgi:spoIIIJ-associated protein
MTFREFTGKNVEEAIRSAMKEFSSDLGELDIEILAQGSRGILGVGGEEARILAAPKSAVAAAETVRAEPEAAAAPPEPSEPPEVAPQAEALAPSLMPQDDAGDQAI